MAEFVQQNMEEMLPELEQLQRVQLLSPEEVKQVIKMRRRFEYKIQKQAKKKEDFLAYIQYESSLLTLLSLRRDKIGYDHKKNEIDYCISRRIHKLFRILEHRFGNDIKIWNSHIEFLKNMNWKVELSKVLRRFIQAHTNQPKIWISAAKTELEALGNVDNARKIMLEGLRFHPKSQELFREYFRLEIIYVDLLNKRSSVLGIDGSNGLHGEFRDQVISGDIILAVLDKAIEAIPDVHFICSLLHVIASCEDPSTFERVKDRIIEILRQDFANYSSTWDTLGRYALFNGDLISTVCKIYEEGIEIIMDANESEDLMSCYIDTLCSLPSALHGNDSLSIIGHKLCTVFHLGHTKGILKDNLYSEWISLLDPTSDDSQIRSILSDASKRYPDSLILLKESIAHSFLSDNYQELTKELIERFFTGIQNKPRSEDSIPLSLLEFMFVNISSRDGSLLENFYHRCRGGCSSWDKAVRSLYFDHLYTVKGLEAAKAFYEANKVVPPFDLSFHLKALEFEGSLMGHEGTKKVDKNRLRSIFEAAVDQFGKDNIDIWLRYIAFATDNGNSSEVTSIKHRAENSLQSSELKEKFRIEFESR